MTEQSIQRLLNSHFGDYNYRLFNSFVYGWESDFFCVSKSGYAIEVEIKVSRGDFRNDFKCKTGKHNLFCNHLKPAIVERTHPWKGYPEGRSPRNGESSVVWFCTPADKLPNKFYYAVPEGMISKDECPPYAGLLYVRGYDLVMIKQAPFLHKQKNDLTKVLLDKFYWKSTNLKINISDFLFSIGRNLNDEELARLDQYLTKLKATI
ncbi:hypothetical protein [Hufsiella ginkgonis]|uniref:MmcB family DNA repair protein n=1 Tax=Hufsiella ginkgonis TaxID=2695274 RepID=A0A7K1Y0N7_9SPHI|nr:hypothetical protein [Hufsiella ginkgonis]MXV16844.1 hypothetical protein [Hufsiella ginkgonis]